MPMNLVWSAWSRSKLVSDITSDAMIGPAVNSARPISHGPRKTYPQIASRVDGRSVHRERRGRGVTGRAWDVSVIGGSGSCGRGGRGSRPGRLGDPPGTEVKLRRVRSVVLVEDALEGRLQRVQ